MLVFFEKKHYIYTAGLYSSDYSFGENVIIDLYRYAIGLFGSITIISIIQILYNLITLKINRRLPLSLGFSKIGEKSLQIYALSSSFLSFYLAPVYKRVAAHVGYNFLAHNMVVYDFVYTPLIAIIYAFGLYFLIKLFYKIKFGKILFGK